MVSILASGLRRPRLDSQLSQFIIHVAEVNQPSRLEESGQWLDNVDQTHLVLASGKLALQKTLRSFSLLSKIE